MHLVAAKTPQPHICSGCNSFSGVMSFRYDAVIDGPDTDPLPVVHQAIVDSIGKSTISHHGVDVLTTFRIERLFAGAFAGLTRKDFSLQQN